jgi:hypothetical protein
MALKQKLEVDGTTELRMPACSNLIHRKIEKYMKMVDLKEDRYLTKPEATEELLRKATKHIKL